MNTNYRTNFYLLVITLGALTMPLQTSTAKAISTDSQPPIDPTIATTDVANINRLNTSHFDDNVYINANAAIKQDMSKIGTIIKRYIFEERVDSLPVAVPLSWIDTERLSQQPDSAIYRLGHSSMLIKLQDTVWLTDPVFSMRASPVQWAGPKRFHPVPLDLDALPEIEGVIISHDHYDHLDQASIQSLDAKVKHFIVPLGVDKHLIDWGISADKIHALDWWQSITIKQVQLTATPAQHFSGRGLFDGNQTLWASWVIKTAEHRLFFSGDSGYFDGFKLIGERYGPFDMTMMETGAYDRDWADIHMTPEKSVQAHVDLRGKILMPIHNSTFDLALHPWYEPFERLSVAAHNNGVVIATPVIGEKISLEKSRVNLAWWKKNMQLGAEQPAN